MISGPEVKPVVETTETVDSTRSTIDGETQTQESNTESLPNADAKKIETAKVATVADTNEDLTIAQTQVESQVVKTEVQSPTSDHETLSEHQKLQQVINILSQLSLSLKQNPDGAMMIDESQMALMNQLENLLSPAISVSLTQDAEREMLIGSKSGRKELYKKIKAERKAEERATDDLQKIANEKAKLLQAKARNNAILHTTYSLDEVNTALNHGITIPPINFLKNNQALFALYKQKNLIQTQGYCRIIGSDNTPVEVFYQPKMNETTTTARQLANCGVSESWLERFLLKNTSMTAEQAKDTTSLVGTVAIVGGLIAAGRWIFTKKEKDKDRELTFNWKALAALVGGTMALNITSQAITGKGLLDQIDHLRKEGKFLRNDETIKTSTPEEKVAIAQSMTQTILVDVPYPVLAEACSPKLGLIQNIELSKLKAYYQEAIDNARKINNTQAVNRLGAQLRAVESLENNPNALTTFKENLAQMNIKAEDLINPNNTTLNLNEKLANNSQNRHLLEQYAQKKNLIFAPEKLPLLRQKVLSYQQAMTDREFDILLAEGLLMQSNPNYKILNTFSMSTDMRQKWFDGLLALKDENLTLEFIKAEENLILKAYEKEIMIDPKLMHISDFVDDKGRLITFETPEDLMRTALLINWMRHKDNTRSESPDTAKKMIPNPTNPTEKILNPDWPFTISSILGVKTLENLIFLQQGGNEITIISDRIPFLSLMDRKFSTIEANENRQHFARYLNKLRIKDHPTT